MNQKSVVEPGDVKARCFLLDIYIYKKMFEICQIGLLEIHEHAPATFRELTIALTQERDNIPQETISMFI